MLAKFSLFQKSLVLVMIPLLVQCFFVFVLTDMLKQADEEIKREHHARVLVFHLNRLTAKIIASAGGVMLPNKKGRSGPEHAVQDEFDSLKEFAKDPAVLKEIERTEIQWQEALQAAKDLKHAVNEKRTFESIVGIEAASDHLDQIYERLTKITEAAQEVLQKSPRRQSKRREQIKELLFYGLGANFTLAVLLVWFFNKSTTERLMNLMGRARQIEAGSRLEPPAKGADEITELDKVLFEVSEILSKSNERLKQTDARIRSIVETLTVGIIIARANGEIDFVNQVMEKLFKHEQLKFIGSSIDDHISFADGGFQAIVGSQKSEILEETKVLETMAYREDGHKFPVAVVLKKIDWLDDKKRFLIALEDISERKRIEKLRSDFTAMITHNVRSPLNSLLAFLELLSRGKYGTLNEKGKDSVVTVERAIDLIVTLISDLLDLDKIEAGLLELNLSDTTNEEIVNRSIAAVKNLAELKHIELSSDIGKADLKADQGRLIQVLVNLVSNAVNHCDEGSKITIVSQQEKELVRFVVKDNGPGIPEDKLPTIFEKFTQVSSMKKGTSGLGLTISRALVEEHGGEIGVESEFGKGSKFWFVVPVSQRS